VINVIPPAILRQVRWLLWGCCNSFFQQLVKFSSVKPNATTFWAVVNFDALSVSHDQSGVGAIGTFHVFLQR
jgi:hypothetical protein